MLLVGVAPKKALESPGTNITDDPQCCQSSPDPLEEQAMLLTVAPSLSLSPGESFRTHRVPQYRKAEHAPSGQAPRKMNKEASIICLVFPATFISQISEELGRGPSRLCATEGDIRSWKVLS